MNDVIVLCLNASNSLLAIFWILLLNSILWSSLVYFLLEYLVLQCALFAGYQFDYVFDWTMLKYPQIGATSRTRVSVCMLLFLLYDLSFYECNGWLLACRILLVMLLLEPLVRDQEEHQVYLSEPPKLLIVSDSYPIFGLIIDLLMQIYVSYCMVTKLKSVNGILNASLNVK